MTEAHVSEEALLEHSRQIVTTHQRVTDATVDAVRFLERALDDARAEKLRHRSVVANAQTRSASVSREEGHEQEREAASHALNAARDSLEKALTAERSLERTLSQVQAATRRTMKLVTERTERGSTFIRARLDPTKAYLVPTGAAIIQSAGGGGGSARGSSVSPQGPRGTVREVAGHPSLSLVPLSLIDDSDSYVTGAESFHKSSAADLTWAIDALEYVVLPAMKQGASPELFASRDAAEGLSGDRSYTETYRGFFGDDSGIKLSPGTNGGYTVTNGYHRIWLAKSLGVEALPAQIVGG